MWRSYPTGVQGSWGLGLSETLCLRHTAILWWGQPVAGLDLRDHLAVSDITTRSCAGCKQGHICGWAQRPHRPGPESWLGP